MVLTRTDLDEIKRIVSDEVRATITSQLKSQLADAIYKRIEAEFENTLKALKDQTSKMEMAIVDLQKENIQLKNKLDSQEQFSRGRNIRIFGMAAEKDKNLTESVLNLFTGPMKINNLNQVDIKRCQRVESKNRSSGKPAAILVEFSDINKRAMVLKNRKYLKSTGISVKEDLTKNRLELLNAAINKFTVKNAWCLHGIVYVKGANGVIHRVDDVKCLEQLH